MFKKDLVVGMVYVTKNGGTRLVSDCGIIDLADGHCIGSLNILNDDLTHYKNDKYDVVAVYSDVTLSNLVWERPVKLLDDQEKDYLASVIKPFKTRVYGIVKCRENGFDFIDIRLYSALTDGKSRISLPYFVPNAMYRGMEIGKTYSLEDLGL